MSILSRSGYSFAEVAQLVEHSPEERGVAGSSPALSTTHNNPPKRRFCCFSLTEHAKMVLFPRKKFFVSTHNSVQK